MNDEDAQTAALQEYFDSNKPAGYGASFRAGWNAARASDRDYLSSVDQADAFQQQYAEERERRIALENAMKEIRACIEHLYSNHTYAVARLPDDLVKYAGPLSIIDRMSMTAFAAPAERQPETEE